MARITCLITLLLAGALAQASPLYLTGIATYGGDASANLVSGFWNTACSPNVAQLTITGHTTCQLSVDITVPGTYTFDYTPFSGSITDQYLNLELFFNGEFLNPGIHAILDLNTAVFTAPASNLQQCLHFNSHPACAPPPSGPSSLVFTVGSQTVTLLNFTADRNWAGQIQFEMTDPNYQFDVPEPSTMVLVGGGVLLLIPRLRRWRPDRQ